MEGSICFVAISSIDSSASLPFALVESPQNYVGSVLPSLWVHRTSVTSNRVYLTYEPWSTSNKPETALGTDPLSTLSYLPRNERRATTIKLFVPASKNPFDFLLPLRALSSRHRDRPNIACLNYSTFFDSDINAFDITPLQQTEPGNEHITLSPL